MECPYCNKEIPDESKFCTYCGKGFEGEETAESAPANTIPPEEDLKQDDAQAGGVSLLKGEPQPEGGNGPSAEPQPDDAGVQSPETERKAGKKFAIGAAVAAGAALIGCAVFFMLPPKDPKTVVIDAFKSVNAEGQTDPMEELFGVNELYQKLSRESAQIETELMLNEISDPTLSFLETGKLSLLGMQDVENKQYFAKLGIGYGDMDIANLEIYYDGKNVSMAIPEISDKAFSLNYADDLEGQLANSPFLGGIILESGIDMAIVQEYLEYVLSVTDISEGQIFDIPALWERYKTGSQAIDDLKAAMTVEKGEKKSFMIDGKDRNCQGYKATITNDALIEFLEVSKEFFLTDETLKGDFLEYMSQTLKLAYGMNQMYDDESLTAEAEAEMLQKEIWDEIELGMDNVIYQLEESMGDVNMVVYVDRKGRLAALEAETTAVIYDTDFDIALNAELQGGYNLTANGKGTITIEAEGETLTMDFIKTGTYDENALTSAFELSGGIREDNFALAYDGTYDRGSSAFDIDLGLSANDMEVFHLSGDGEVQDLEKGKAISVILDSLLFEVPYTETSLELSGSYKIASLAGAVTKPQGELFDILAATETDFAEVLEDMSNNLWGLLYQFQ